MTHSDEFLEGVIVGVAAGVIAAFVTEQFQNGWNIVQKRLTGTPAEGAAGQEDPPTIQLADRLATAATGEPTPAPYRERAGAVVHYLIGAGIGGLYDGLARRFPAVTTGHGIAYGVVLDVVLDEAVVPALRLAPPPNATPALKHLFGLASHLVFGLSLETTRRLLRRSNAGRSSVYARPG